jgi:hypothetical protein
VSDKPTFDKQRLIFGLYLLVLITALEIATGKIHVPAWPAFLAMIFFFVEHMDPKKVPAIVVGGTAGIASIMLALPIIGVLAPLLGPELARLAFILILVYAIVAFGEMVPLLFNNYMFMSLTVTGVAVQLPNPNPVLWCAIALVGGTLLIGGVVMIGKIMTPRASSAAPSPEAGTSRT